MRFAEELAARGLRGVEAAGEGYDVVYYAGADR